MLNFLKALAARLPLRWQQNLKRFHFGRQIKRRQFRTEEREHDLLPALVSPGDWVIDVGANVGHYTARLSALVGASGRVIAFEPVPDTFELLSANVALLPTKNVTLVNAAASDRAGTAVMSIPVAATGLRDNYLAQISAEGTGPQVLTLAVDALELAQPIRLVKIDAEGHDLAVLQGMAGLLRRDGPVLIVEDGSSAVADFLAEFGYTSAKLPGSCNRIFRQKGDAGADLDTLALAENLA